MAPPDLDAQIDQLYQLPLDEFTPARNALAKALKRPTIKDLDKPNIAAWAVNQLYWKERSAYHQLVQAAEQLRDEHRKLLSGKASDVRETEKAHRDAVRLAMEKIKSLLKGGGQAATDATLVAVQETLQSLPSKVQPGRLARPLKPMGFEALAGIPSTSLGGSRPKASGSSPLQLVKSATDEKRDREQARQREQERERKQRQRQAEKELKAAEAAMLRAEDAVKKAEQELGKLRAKRDEAVNEYQRARLRAHE